MKNTSDKMIITTFTDPMMGLSYECEPIFRRLETHFCNQIEFRYVMCGLVRDVSDFMTPDELSYTPNEGIKRYNKRLASIYKSEEAISNMPINMEDFHLFDTEHRSSFPLNIAYEAAKLAEPAKADLFLYNLRYSTIVDTRQTTRTDEILKVVRKTGIDEEAFTQHYNNGSALSLFEKDKEYASSLGIYSLPAYLFQYGDRSTLINSLIGYDTFTDVISSLSENNIVPHAPDLCLDSLEKLLQKHPVISPIEICYAYDLKDESQLLPLLQQLVDDMLIQIVNVGQSYFIFTKTNKNS